MMKVRSLLLVAAGACAALASCSEEKPAPAPPKETSVKEEKVDLSEQLEKESKTLEDLRAKFLSNHPKLKEQERKVADLKEQIAKNKLK